MKRRYFYTQGRPDSIDFLAQDAENISIWSRESSFRRLKKRDIVGCEAWASFLGTAQKTEFVVSSSASLLLNNPAMI